MKKILFIASHRFDRAPGQRFRFEQYLDFLRLHGFESEISSIISEQDDRFIYKPGFWLNKFILFFPKSKLIRLKDTFRKNDYDVIFIAREALMTHSVFFEKQFKKSRARLVYDFDDSIWIRDVSEANRLFGWLKNPGKISKIIALCDHVIAGNHYLADYARNYNSSITIIPTTINTVEYCPPAEKKDKNTITIGWSGSVTTIRHFSFIVPVLTKIKEKYGNTVDFKVIGDDSFSIPSLGIQGQKWLRTSEIQDLCDFDIGIMPLPDDKWAKGKCGLKGLQYMALEIPTIMSPVGINTEIIRDGENGFLASDEDEWFEKLSRLIESKALREKLGREARNTVIRDYSFDRWKQTYLKLFQDLTS